MRRPTCAACSTSPALGGDDIFLVYEDERLTFDDVFAQVDALADALVDRYGVAKGDRVAIGMRNYPEWIMSFAAIISIGAVSVSLNAWWTEDELDYALEDCGATLLIADVERIARAIDPCRRLGVRMLEVRARDALSADDVDQWNDVVVLGRFDARRRHRPGRRRHDPLHLGHHRAARRARCRPTGAIVPSAAGVRLSRRGRRGCGRARADRPSPRPVAADRRSSSSCRCSTSPAACR